MQEGSLFFFKRSDLLQHQKPQTVPARGSASSIQLAGYVGAPDLSNWMCACLPLLYISRSVRSCMHDCHVREKGRSSRLSLCGKKKMVLLSSTYVHLLYVCRKCQNKCRCVSRVADLVEGMNERLESTATNNSAARMEMRLLLLLLLSKVRG